MRNRVARSPGCVWLCTLVLSIALLPAGASAQSIRSTVTGVVTDSSGAVLPGVTVEVASPALIEKVRSAVTDSSGAFRIIELASGTYTVTFSLAGFNIVRREGIVLTGSMTATINAELQVGTLTETIRSRARVPLWMFRTLGSRR